MWPRFFPVFPERASTMAERVDTLYFALIAMSVFWVVLIAATIVYFGFRYRRRRHGEIGREVHAGWTLEVAWTAIPLLITLTFFVWGANVYFSMGSPPPDTVDIYVVAKQWMFKFQHQAGQREIDELHVPVGRPVKLTMTSEDVIHDLYVPAFRIKADILPGRYTTIWFTATKPGNYHLFCAEYCGTKHSGMVGQIVVMEPAQYQAWLGGGTSEGSMASAGEKLFQDLGCITCHRADGQGRGPVLQGLYGKRVDLSNGENVVADDAYIRESILNPTAKIVAGFQPIMPTFQGVVSEEQVLQLIEYVKSLASAQPPPQPQQNRPGPRPGEATPARPPQGPPAKAPAK
ncbi:MAG: cytochrome c oxidase subunit II [Bacteroidales bacterium]